MRMSDRGDGLVLAGLSGAGKSTAGRLLAKRLGRPFADTDELIAARVGQPAPAFLAERGEPVFRAVERDAIHDALATPGAIVATGGGALNDPLNRWQLWSHGRVAWLDAPDPQLLQRLEQDETPRPMLASRPAEKLAALREERLPFYRAADALVDTHRPPEFVVEALARLMDRPLAPGRRLFDAEEPRHHPIGPSEARIVYGHGMGAAPLDEVLEEIGGSPALVADRAVRASPPIVRRFDVEGGEGLKQPGALLDVLSWLAAAHAERRDPVVGLGGGTVGDLAGLAASLYARGVPYVAVPTTWLAQADAAIGGKAAVDLPEAKNIVGAFWPAWAVVADTAHLARLPLDRLRDGMAEAIKAAIVGDPELWQLIVDRGSGALDGTDDSARYAITERAVRLKLGVVRRDPWEAGERRQLNLGHTIGHALETASGYTLAHGTAVAIGLRAACVLAAGRGGAQVLAPELDDLLERLGFRLRTAFEPDTVRSALGADKKRAAGRQRWLLPMELGHVVEVDDISDEELDAALTAIQQG
jgi:3-dehydroquinate synthetase/shikimate kinase